MSPPPPDDDWEDRVTRSPGLLVPLVLVLLPLAPLIAGWRWLNAPEPERAWRRWRGRAGGLLQITTAGLRFPGDTEVVPWDEVRAMRRLSREVKPMFSAADTETMLLVHTRDGLTRACLAWDDPATLMATATARGWLLGDSEDAGADTSAAATVLGLAILAAWVAAGWALVRALGAG